MLRFCEDKFNETHLSTIGVDFKVKFVEVDDKVIKLQIWDTAGQEKFKSITQSYYKSSQGCLAVFDITSKQSFDAIKSYVDFYVNESSTLHPMNIILVGNKTDNELNREVQH